MTLILFDAVNLLTNELPVRVPQTGKSYIVYLYIYHVIMEDAIKIALKTEHIITFLII